MVNDKTNMVFTGGSLFFRNATLTVINGNFLADNATQLRADFLYVNGMGQGNAEIENTGSNVLDLTVDIKGNVNVNMAGEVGGGDVWVAGQGFVELGSMWGKGGARVGVDDELCNAFVFCACDGDMYTRGGLVTPTKPHNHTAPPNNNTAIQNQLNVELRGLGNLITKGSGNAMVGFLDMHECILAYLVAHYIAQHHHQTPTPNNTTQQHTDYRDGHASQHCVVHLGQLRGDYLGWHHQLCAMPACDRPECHQCAGLSKDVAVHSLFD